MIETGEELFMYNLENQKSTLYKTLMKIIIPQNIFSSIFESIIPKNSGIEIIRKESALISRQLETNTSAVALIPTIELINHKTFFVSQKLGFSFDGFLSNAYFSLIGNERNISRLKIRGDISINEIVLSKIIFSERYSSEIEISLDPAKDRSENTDYLIVGDENFLHGDYKNGISFADQMSELLDLPYVNYVFVSQDRESLENFNSLFSEVDLKIEDELPNILGRMNLTDELRNYLKESIGSVYFELTENEIDAVKELIKLVYYHGIVDDLFDVKFI
jgi:hypothetical protein